MWPMGTSPPPPASSLCVRKIRSRGRDKWVGSRPGDRRSLRRRRGSRVLHNSVNSVNSVKTFSNLHEKFAVFAGGSCRTVMSEAAQDGIEFGLEWAGGHRGPTGSFGRHGLVHQ